MNWKRVLVFAVLGPVVFYLGQYLRFGHLTSFDAYQGAGIVLGFAAVGAVSGVLLLLLIERADSRLVTALTAAGYCLAIPLAYWQGLLAPLAHEGVGRELSDAATYLLLFPALIAVFGSIPLLAGALIPWAASKGALALTGAKSS